MQDLLVSINDSTNEPEADFRLMLGEIEKELGIRVQIQLIRWSGDTWKETMRIVIYRQGPIMSQIGTTWMGSLEATDALRPFSPAEIHRILGDQSNVPDASWKTVTAQSGDRIIGIPWVLDAYMLYYRKDLLEKAHLDPATAFSSLEALNETIIKLNESGVEIPFALPQAISRACLHNVANWIWTQGGEFLTPDSKNLLLSDPKTRAGIRQYFSLSKYLPKPAQGLDDQQCYEVFMNGRAAITMRNAALVELAKRRSDFKPHLENLGVAAMPGINFVGGSNLVLWKHIPAHQERLAIGLLERILSPEAQFLYNIHAGALPARKEALEKVRNETVFRPIIDAIMNGRSFQKFPLWGLVEDKLSLALGQIWQDLYSQESPNIDDTLNKILDPVERRLQLTLSNS